MGTALRVLFIEDSDDDTALQVRMLRQASYDVEFDRVDSPSALTEVLGQKWDLIISDYSMPQFTGTDALRLVRERDLDVPFLFVSGTIGEDTAVAALKVGAQDYLMKTNLSRLIPAVRRELREAEERRQRRRLEQQIHQLQRFEAIGRLAGGVAHDFNNMIGAILGWADMGYEEASPNSRVQERFQMIRSQAERAASLTRQLLAYARRQILQPCNTNLNELVRAEIRLLRNVIGERIEIQTALAQELWATWADATQVEQILMNLCLNARDALSTGGRLLIETQNVEIEEDYHRVHAYARPGRFVLLRVSDTGTGMDAATLEHIFEPFFTTKEIGKGTGLGLATVYGIVKQHKGFIDADSAPGQGSVFRVYLPAGAGLGKAPEDRADDTLRSGHENILVAEDNEGLRNVAKEILETLGYQVVLAKDGAEAVRIFENIHERIDLVFMDVVMPGLNGPEAYAQMCSVKPNVPVLFTTGYATEAHLVPTRLSVPVSILDKPYGMKALGQKLRAILDRKSE
jgi:signal transduction histidine kinase